MATLRHPETRRFRPLSARLLVGRGPSCDLRLEDRHVSGEHATLMWTRGRWEIRDLGSRNGTFVNGQRVAPGERRELGAGDRLAFGNEGDPWELTDDGPPSALAENLGTGALSAASEGILALPSDNSPEVVVYADARGCWVIERTDDDARLLEADEIVQVAGVPYRIHVPAQQEGTATIDMGPTLDTVRLRFAVSRDEEHVQVTVLYRGREIPLEPREHGYTLLTLARQRIEDQAQPLAEQGWIDRDELLRMLGMDANALNVAIYRARGQLSSAGIEGAAGVVEVRRGQRRLGLEPDRIEVVPMT